MYIYVKSCLPLDYRRFFTVSSFRVFYLNCCLLLQKKIQKSDLLVINKNANDDMQMRFGQAKLWFALIRFDFTIFSLSYLFMRRFSGKVDYDCFDNFSIFSISLQKNCCAAKTSFNLNFFSFDFYQCFHIYCDYKVITQ